jgi:hypothetical protein
VTDVTLFKDIFAKKMALSVQIICWFEQKLYHNIGNAIFAENYQK